jgi:hypothetical protein
MTICANNASRSFSGIQKSKRSLHLWLAITIIRDLSRSSQDIVVEQAAPTGFDLTVLLYMKPLRRFSGPATYPGRE